MRVTKDKCNNQQLLEKEIITTNAKASLQFKAQKNSDPSTEYWKDGHYLILPVSKWYLIRRDENVNWGNIEDNSALRTNKLKQHIPFIQLISFLKFYSKKISQVALIMYFLFWNKEVLFKIYIMDVHTLFQNQNPLDLWIYILKKKNHSLSTSKKTRNQNNWLHEKKIKSFR